MKLFNKQILEAVSRGINIALDDFEDEEIEVLKDKKLVDNNIVKNLIDLDEVTVDLGLPSGTLWCKCNLGAILPYEYGNYYAWGETKPNRHLTNKLGYAATNYKFCNGNVNGTGNIQKYRLVDFDIRDISNIRDDKFDFIRLLPKDDAAYKDFHFKDFKFHIPTKELFEELLAYTYDDSWRWTLNYMNSLKNGRLFVSKINGKMIFLPAAGSINGKSLLMPNLEGAYWTSSLYKEGYRAAYNLYFNSKNYGVSRNSRYLGLPIRPVINLIK